MANSVVSKQGKQTVGDQASAETVANISPAAVTGVRKDGASQ